MEQIGPLRKRVVKIMEEKGRQSVKELCENLNISNGSARSVLIKMHQAGVLERVGHGVYKIRQ